MQTESAAATIKPQSQQSLDTAAAAAYLGIEPGTLEVWRSTKRQIIPYAKIGSRVRYSISDLDAWLQTRRVAA